MNTNEARAIFPGADIGAGAIIRADAIIASVSGKYVGNILPTNEGMFIRIGCEVHTVTDWVAHGEGYARKHGEGDWWIHSGAAMLKFLISEAENYLKQEGK